MVKFRTWFLTLSLTSTLFLALGSGIAPVAAHVAATKPLSSLNKESSPTLLISVGSDALSVIRQEFKRVVPVLEERNDISIIKLHEDEIVLLSHLMHEKFGRCGGFMVHEDLQEGVTSLHDFDPGNVVNSFVANYSITEAKTVQSFSQHLKEESIRSNILKLSSYHNRYYRSKMGSEAIQWIKQKWEGVAKTRSDMKVELFNHSSYPQPSLILTVEGSESPDEVIVIGGHADSIAGFWNRENAKAPGADDNASGIAVITEVIKAMYETNYRPRKTVKFMAYAAEEVGLLGSNDIARDFKNKDIQVLGVLQLDMTNFKAGEWDIAIMSDYSDSSQNRFLGQLIDEYVKVPWGYSQCGYGCSDHASWTKNGYPASIPFETKMELSNKKIHTANDTLESMGGRADHALKFAKLAAAYMIELAK